MPNIPSDAFRCVVLAVRNPNNYPPQVRDQANPQYIDLIGQLGPRFRGSPQLFVAQCEEGLIGFAGLPSQQTDFRLVADRPDLLSKFVHDSGRGRFVVAFTNAADIELFAMGPGLFKRTSFEPFQAFVVFLGRDGHILGGQPFKPTGTDGILDVRDRRIPLEPEEQLAA